MDDVVQRRSARVLVADHDGHVLLLQGFDPHVPDVRYWFTPGGGIKPDESPVSAAVRELREETGLEVTEGDLGEPVHHDVTVFPFEGRTYRQVQDYFLLVVPRYDAVPVAFDPHEQRSVCGLAWWHLDDLAVASDVRHPVELVDLVRNSIAGRR